MEVGEVFPCSSALVWGLYINSHIVLIKKIPTGDKMTVRCKFLYTLLAGRVRGFSVRPHPPEFFYL